MEEVDLNGSRQKTKWQREVRVILGKGISMNNVMDGRLHPQAKT